MLNPREKEAEFAWQVVEFIQTLTDLLWGKRQRKPSFVFSLM